MKNIIVKIMVAVGVLAGIGIFIYSYHADSGSDTGTDSISMTTSSSDIDIRNQEDLADVQEIVKTPAPAKKSAKVTKDTTPVDDDMVQSVPPPLPSISDAAPSLPAPIAVASSQPMTLPPVIQAVVPTYLISVSSIGNGGGMVSSSPAGILCGFTCQAQYRAGTKISFAETPSVGSVFKGWSGGCKGVGPCSFVASSSLAVVADFELLPVSVPIVPSGQEVATATTTVAIGQHILIAQVQVAGAASANDFVKLFNPTGTAIDMSGWKLHKRSSTGTDYSLRTFGTGSEIGPGDYFVWANSNGGFADSIGANVSSTETVSADNSVALFDADGNIVDQVAWGTGAGQYVEGTAYPTDPPADQVLTRDSADGVMVDTDDNANDFTITSSPTS